MTSFFANAIRVSPRTMFHSFLFILTTTLLLPGTTFAGLFDEAVSGDADAAESDSGDSASEPGLSSSGLSASAGGFNFELNGHVRGDLFVGKVPDSADAEVKSGYGEGALKLRVRKMPYGDAYAETRLKSGYEYGEQKTELTLREAYVNAYGGPFDFRFGQQIILWGRADGINPTNNLTPMDLRVKSPDEDDRRAANFGLRVFFNWSPIRIEAVWLPFFAASWLPPFELADNIINDGVAHPGPELSNGLGAGRFHLELPEIEMSVSYLYGYAPQPGIAMKSWDIVDGAPVMSIELRPYKQHVIGFDFSAAVFDWFGLRGEAAYRDPVVCEYTLHAPNPDLQYVIGFDREIEYFTMIVQYYGRYTFDWEEHAEPAMPDIAGLPDKENLPQVITDQIDAGISDNLRYRNQMIHNQKAEVQHSVMARLSYAALHETLDLELMGIINISTLEWMLQPRIAYDITDALTVTFGGQLFMGPDDTLYGMVDEIQSAGYTEFKVSF